MKKLTNLTHSVLKTTYSVTIPNRIFIDRCVGDDTDTYDYLVKNAPGSVDEIEYGGFYGSIIMFCTNNDTDRDAFIKVIQDCLSMSKRALKKALHDN